MIRHKDSGRTFAVNDDGDARLAFLDDIETSSSFYWKCVEKDRWFRFKHEGRYLGHDGKESFHAENEASQVLRVLLHKVT